MASRFSHQALIAALVVVAASCASSGPARAQSSRNVVTAADLEKNAHEPIENILQRKISGVTVIKNADGAIWLQIRGNATIMQDEPKRPLYVLNDMPFEPGPEGLARVNRQDIESIKILKGADAAIYGIEGANGVVVITTKKPTPPKSSIH